MATAPTVLSILHLNPCKFGSIEEYTVFLSRALREKGWKSVLVFSHPIEEDIRRHFDGTDVVIESFRCDSTLRMYTDILRILRKYRAEILHFHYFNHFTLIALVAWVARPRAVFFSDRNRQPGELSWLTRWECRLWDRLVLGIPGTRIIAVSSHVKQLLVDCFQMLPERIRVVYNAVNPARFTPLETEQQSKLRNELGIPSGQPVVVCASNLRPEKGIDHLMQAASRVLAKRPDTYFVIVGGGPLAPQLQEFAVKLGIAANVRFTGLRSDVHRYMAMANVVAVPSVWQEPAGFVVIEAMACGRPVVATRAGGIPEYMADGVTGIAVDPAAPEQLANALLRLLNSPEEAAAMGRAGRTRVEDRLSIDRWVRETISLYEEALRARRSK